MTVLTKSGDRLDDVAAHLRRAVAISSAANRIIAIASTFRLTTLNAAILTTQGGASARGFAQVAEELRRFSENVNAQMHALKDAALAPVASVASVLKYVRLAQVMKQTGARDGRGSLQAATRQVDATIEANLATLSALTRRVRPELERGIRINRLGRGLARVAKIEATRCTQHGAELMRVSEEFEAQIAQIDELLQSIEAQTQGGGR